MFLPTPTLTGFIDSIESDPLNTLKFLIPSIIVIFYFLVLKVASVRNKTDRNPDLKQEKEIFKVPKDYLNMEMVYVEKSDIEHVSDIILKSSRKVNIITKKIKSEYRKYKRIKYRITFVQSEKRKRVLEKRLSDITEGILKDYKEIRNSMLELGDEK
ncbi:hypothetical protein ACNF42_01630 [Cuniculiplasma sp. SKW3]|uniref:hypothetical protein n=1 Tax=unclassified Cuniculiplasma TaxID=2619706 RepID=UPI003FD31BC8